MTAQARRDEGSPREVGEAEAGLREERWNRYYVVGGAMRPDAPSYVEREADRQLLEQLLHGEYCYVLTARQMGKSSLMVRAAARLRAAGHRVVLLDLTALGSHTTVEQWYEGLFGYLASQVGGEDELEEFWASQAGLAPLPRFMAALREAASRTPAPREGRYAAPGPEAAGRLFLFLDEIDVVRGLPFSTDEFFAAIREWYNRRAVDPLCEQVTFCFLGVATPADLIQDPQASPFNIGCSIELRDFTLEEAEPLARGLLPPDSARRLPFAEPPFAPRRLLRRILYWTAGHPYLTQRLCLLVSRLPPSGGMGPVAVDRLCRERFLSPGARDRDDNLHFVRDRLLRTAADPAALLELYARIHAGARVSVAEDHPLLDALRLAGIVKPWVGTALGRLLDRSGTARYRVRNRIYAQVFDREWVRRNMPDAERQRQRAAFRQGMLRAGLLAAAVVTALSGATLAALHNAAVARRALAEARRSGAQALQSERVARRALVNARENAARADRDARRADAAEEQERRHRRTAEAASRRATAAGTDALHQARLADAAREQIRRQTVRAYVSAGARADAERDPLTALYWFVEALRLDPADPLPHRRRIATALGRCPRLLRTWGAPGGVWGSVQLSPDGRRVAAVSGAGWLSVWDAPTGRVLFSGLHVPRAAGLLAFDSRGTQVVVGTGSGPNWLCDLSREPVRILRLPGEGPLYSAQFTLDGTSLVVAGSEGTARVFRLGAEHRLLPPLRHGGPIGAGRFSPDGLGVLTGGWDGIGRLWTREGAPLGTALTHPGPIHGAGFAPDGSRILLWGPRSVSVLEAGSGRRLATHGALHVTRVALGPDSRNAVVVRDGLVEFLDLRTGVRPVPPVRRRNPPLDAVFLPDGSAVLTVDTEGRLVRLDPAAGELEAPLLSLPGPFTQAQFDREGRFLLTEGGGLLRLWDVRPEEEPAGLLRLQARGVPAAVSPAGNALALAATNGVRLWRSGDPGTAGRRLELGGAPLHLAFSEDGSRLAGAALPDQLRLWDTATGHARPLPPLPIVPGARLVLDRRGDSLYVVTPGRGAYRWDAGGRTWTSQGLDGFGAPSLFAISSDGRRVAGRESNRLEVRMLQRDRVQPGAGIPEGPAMGLAFSPNGRWLVTGGTPVRFWESETGRPSGPPLPHHAGVPSLRFDRAGARLLTASVDGVRSEKVGRGRESSSSAPSNLSG